MRLSRGGRQPYCAPRLQARTFQQAALFLTGHAWIGNQNARDLLELLFPLPSGNGRDERDLCAVQNASDDLGAQY